MTRTTESGKRALLAVAVVLAVAAPPTDGALGRVTYRVGEGRPTEASRLLPLYRGTRTTITVHGPGVEKCERVELGAAVSVRHGHGASTPDRLGFEAVTDAAAPLGARELKLRYPIELAGPEVFPARVLRGGVVEAVAPRRVEAGRPVVLAFTGRDLGNADVLTSGAWRDARVLPGSTETLCRVQLTFVEEGVLRVALYDRDGPPMPADGVRLLGGHATHPEALVEVVRAGAKS